MNSSIHSTVSRHSSLHGQPLRPVRHDWLWRILLLLVLTAWLASAHGQRIEPPFDCGVLSVRDLGDRFELTFGHKRPGELDWFVAGAGDADTLVVESNKPAKLLVSSSNPRNKAGREVDLGDKLEIAPDTEIGLTSRHETCTITAHSDPNKRGVAIRFLGHWHVPFFSAPDEPPAYSDLFIPAHR